MANDYQRNAHKDLFSLPPFIVVVFLLANQHLETATGEAANPTELDCQQRLMEKIFACVTDQGIDFNTFLLVITDQGALQAKNETAKSPRVFSSSSTNDTEAFRVEACSVRDPIMLCSLEAAKTLIKTPACAHSVQGVRDSQEAFSLELLDNDQRYLIKEQLEAVLGQFDTFCSHPCRETLLEDMRKCYDTNGINPDLFISNEPGGAVIGDSQLEVDNFCKNRTSLVRCMYQTAVDCPEADLVLGAIGLDLGFMEKGFSVLCEDQETYLRSLDCFETHTEDVGLCHSAWYRSVLNISRRAVEDGWREDDYFQEICGLKLAHIQCDLDAWAIKDDESCDTEILALKRRLHCALIPSQCISSHSADVSRFCGATADSSVSILLSSIQMLILMCLISLSYL